MAFGEVASRVFDLYGRSEYARALATVRDARRDFPEEDHDLTFWEACLLARCGRAEEAVDVLAGGIERGRWWSTGKLADSDLDPVRSLPGWEDIAQRCAALTEQARAHRPPPHARPADSPAGTVVALQGAHADPEFVARWEAVVPDRWALVVPTGSEPTPEGEWEWPYSVQEAARSAAADLTDLTLSTPLVLAGFSIGAAIVAGIVGSGRLDVAGMVAVAPSSPAGFAELRDVAECGSPMLVLCGGLDRRADAYRLLQRQLAPHPAVGFHLIEGAGHEEPPDLARRVGAFLEMVEAGRSSA